MLIIAWGPLKYKDVLNYFEVLLVHSKWRMAGVHARGLLEVAALCHLLIYLMEPSAERMQRVTQCLCCCPLWQTVLLLPVGELAGQVNLS